MRTKISSDNPHGYNRWGFAWEHVAEGAAAHLDFGCHDGAFLNTLERKRVRRLVGVDVCTEAVEEGQRLFPNLEMLKIAKVSPLPFDDGTFSSISILDVLEHVYEQTELLVELNRVLKEQGKLIVTVPGRHLFSFLDMGNLKFRFPKLHRWYYCFWHSRKEYAQRYASNPDGLIGDISARKGWHEHFSREKLRRLLGETGFVVTAFDGAGFFSRPLGNVSHFLRRVKPINKVFAKLLSLDMKSFESTNLFCVAGKRRPT